MRQLDRRQPSDDELPDSELVARSKAGDEAAVRIITRRYNQRLYRIARGIVRNDAEAEDVVQETYLRAFTSLDRFRGEAAVGTWLVRIAMNEALGRLRKRRPEVEWAADDDGRVQAQILHFPAASLHPDPERIMAQREIRAILERSIDELPDDFRIVFVARAVEGLSVEETSKLLGLRPETVKTRLHRARKRLRDCLEARIGPVLSETFRFDGARCERLTEAVLRRLVGTH